MGTAVRVEIWQENPNLAKRASDAVFTEIRRIEEVMSPLIAGSELSQINQHSAQRPVVVSDELFQLLKTSKHISDISDGIFDISFSSVGYLYDFRAGKKPSEQQIEQLIDKIDYTAILLDDNTHSVSFKHNGVKLDLGGIAKGYAVDRGIAILRNQGIEHAIVTAGGDSRVLGDHRGRDWMVGIQAPRNRSALATAVPLSNAAISTSGDYERFFIEDGIRFHHIINPKTGDSARKLQSASVIGPEGVMTDALSTTVFILGIERGLAFIEGLPEYEAILIDQHSKMHYSSGFMPAGSGNR
ncbi:MAG: FAD:protein FMN transferase [Pseudomonadales bacterium]|nr:FAD:protein FMN transferase [Pseudomonadales bacterium]